MRYYRRPIFYELLCFQFISITLLSSSSSSSSSSSARHLCSQTQSDALIQFKSHFSINKTASNCEDYGLKIKPYPKTNSWKKGIDCCLWDGVSCDNITGHVIGLDLSCSFLSGSFPSNTTFFLLSHLQSLDLSFNDFKNSEISSKFGLFQSLTHLDLSYSWFSGPVPYEISYLSKLVSLHLSYRPQTDLLNDMQAPGPILKLEESALNGIVRNLTKVREITFDGIDMSSIDPNSFTNLSHSLTSLSLSSCHLRGIFPDYIFKLPNMEVLTLDENPNLTGQFPKYNNSSSHLFILSALSTSLVSLSLIGCNFSGSIPRSIGNLSQLSGLFLSYNYFSGEIPSSITNLTNLRILSLESNRLEGPVPGIDNPNAFPRLVYVGLSVNLLSGTTPTWLYTIPRLNRLSLGNNQFIGRIPSSISKLVNLNYLDLSSNFFDGDLPILPSNIQFLSVSNTNLSGEFPILPPNVSFLSVSNNNLSGELPDICNSKLLEILDFSHNHFTGVIPQCIGSFSQSLSSLNLKMNELHGTIPSTFANGCALKNLNLNGNHFEGPLTPSTTNCKGLEVLDLGNNNINDTFPHWIQALPELQVLVLHSNKFHGPLGAPSSPRSLLKLRIFDLSYNNFSGPLPTSYIRNFQGMMNVPDDGKSATYMGETNYSYDYSVGLVVKGSDIEFEKILTIFTSIDLSSNNFQGEIPTVVGQLYSLRGLNLSHNNLVGRIPPSLGNLSTLEWLDLSSNKLGGQIPTDLLDLTFLSSFNVSDNQLAGLIPQGKQFNTFENSSTQGLCGVPLSRVCINNESPPAPWMNSPEDDGSKFEFGWKVVAIGYGFGFVFGVGMGNRCLQTGKPIWLMTLFKVHRRRW